MPEHTTPHRFGKNVFASSDETFNCVKQGFLDTLTVFRLLKKALAIYGTNSIHKTGHFPASNTLYNTLLKDSFIIAYPSARRSCKLVFCLKIARLKYYIYVVSNPHVDHMTRHIMILSS